MTVKNILVLGLLAASSLFLAACKDSPDLRTPVSYSIYIQNITSAHKDVTDTQCRKDIKSYYRLKHGQTKLEISDKTTVSDLHWSHDRGSKGILNFTGQGNLHTTIFDVKLLSEIRFSGVSFENARYGVGNFYSKYCKGFVSVKVYY